MKKRVKIFATSLLFLGLISLSSETSKAAAICFNVIDYGAGSLNIWRCTPDPEGCELKNVDEYKEQSDFNRLT